jgi:hypothetical protein
MNVEINWLAVVLATLSSMVVGSLWYTPKVFGTAWMRLAKVTPSGNSKDAIKPILITLVVSFISAYVLAHVAYLSNSFFQHSFLQDSVTTAFWLWLGLTAARFVTHDAFEGRPWKLTLMNVSHELVTILIMGLIIGLLAPQLVTPLS